MRSINLRFTCLLLLTVRRSTHVELRLKISTVLLTAL